jgi:hypothetical protein
MLTILSGSPYTARVQMVSSLDISRNSKEFNMLNFDIEVEKRGRKAHRKGRK